MLGTLCKNKKLNEKQSKIVKYFMPSKHFFFSCIYKMSQICKERYKKVETIDRGRYFWVNRKDLEVESDVANWAQIL